MISCVTAVSTQLLIDCAEMSAVNALKTNGSSQLLQNPVYSFIRYPVFKGIQSSLSAKADLT